jgi:acyl phosphate:glycerol-3-phosphate acyltransferase
MDEFWGIVLFYVVPGALFSLALAFFVGSIPFGLIVGKLFFGTDLRKSGSGNIGAANALRSYGRIGGAFVLLLDALKGFVAVFFIPNVMRYDVDAAVFIGTIAPLAGLAAVLGHCYSPWLGFRGGKGVATFLGVLLGLSWPTAAVFVVVWLLMVIPTRFASLGSMIASVLAPLSLWFLRHDAFLSIVTAIAALLIIWKHRENIVRLREGRENKITFGKASA